MTELTHDYLNSLLERHPDGDIRDTVLDLQGRLAELDGDVDPDRKALLTDTVRDLVALLEHQLRTDGRGGEDYINDGVFHAGS